MNRTNRYLILYKTAKYLSMAYLAMLCYSTILSLMQSESIINRVVKFGAGSLLLALLFVAYRLTLHHQRIGGYLHIVIGLIFTINFTTYTNIVNFLLISLPPIASGVLFIYIDLNSID